MYSESFVNRDSPFLLRRGIRLRLERRFWNAVAIWVELLLVVVELLDVGGHSPCARKHAHVQLGDSGLKPFCGDTAYRALIVFWRWPAEGIVALESNRIDPYPLGAKFAHHADDSVDLLLVEHIEVVVVEFRIRVGLMREAERKLDEVLADSVAPG